MPYPLIIFLVVFLSSLVVSLIVSRVLHKRQLRQADEHLAQLLRELARVGDDVRRVIEQEGEWHRSQIRREVYRTPSQYSTAQQLIRQAELQQAIQVRWTDPAPISESGLFEQQLESAQAIERAYDKRRAEKRGEKIEEEAEDYRFKDLE